MKPTSEFLDAQIARGQSNAQAAISITIGRPARNWARAGSWSIGTPAAVNGEYAATVREDGPSSPLFRHAWDELVAASEAPGAIYQTPAFFDYIRKAERDSRFDVVAITNARNAMVGVVPVKRSTLELPFVVGPHKLPGPCLNDIAILGGEPAIPEDPAALDSLFLRLSEHYREAEVIYLNEVRLQSYLWDYLRTSSTIHSLFHTHVMDGFRECHTIPLPRTVEDYTAKLSKSRRYNLLRQVRILQKDLDGPLELETIDSPSGLSELFRALDTLAVRGPHDSLMEQDQYISAAVYGFLQCYLLKSADRPIALVLGRKIGNVYKADKFLHDRSLEKYSPGTTLWHLVVKNMIAAGDIGSVDMGYGSPAYRFRATNTIEYRGRILLFRRSFRNRVRIVARSRFAAAVNFAKRGIGRDPQVCRFPDLAPEAKLDSYA